MLAPNIRPLSDDPCCAGRSGWWPSCAALVARRRRPIRVSVNEVIVPVTVTDEKGRFVSNLTKSDFKIFDENKEQTIDFFSHEQSQPIVIGFLIDTSNGMKIHWDKYKEAATELMLNLLPGDKKYSGYLISYGNTPELIADTSSDSEKMVEKMRKIKPAGGSALFDAIYHGLHEPQDGAWASLMSRGACWW